jgi:hypothetical protein
VTEPVAADSKDTDFRRSTLLFSCAGGIRRGDATALLILDWQFCQLLNLTARPTFLGKKSTAIL